MADVTGWTFREIEDADVEEVRKLLIYKQIKHVIEFGGELDLE